MMNYHIAVDENGRPGMRYWRERLIKNHQGVPLAGAIHEAITPSGRVVYRDIAITHRKGAVTDPTATCASSRKSVSGAVSSTRERQ